MLICDDVAMTLGKACAQVGHAALVGRRLHDQTMVSRWKEDGYPVAVRLVGRYTFDRSRRDLIVAAVRDVGLTEVSAGTETVLALEPGMSLPAWLQLEAQLIS